MVDENGWREMRAASASAGVTADPGSS